MHSYKNNIDTRVYAGDLEYPNQLRNYFEDYQKNNWSSLALRRVGKYTLNAILSVDSNALKLTTQFINHVLDAQQY